MSETVENVISLSHWPRVRSVRNPSYGAAFSRELWVAECLCGWSAPSPVGRVTAGTKTAAVTRARQHWQDNEPDVWRAQADALSVIAFEPTEILDVLADAGYVEAAEDEALIYALSDRLHLAAAELRKTGWN